MRRSSRPLVLSALLAVAAPLLVACGSDPTNEPDPDVPTGQSQDTSTADQPTTGDGGNGASTSGDNGGSSGASDPGGEVEAVEVTSGLTTPWGLVPLEDGSLLVGSRDDAEVLLVPADGGEPTVVGSVDGVRTEGESGLLGLALAPDASTLYAYRTGGDENGVVRMSWDGERLGEPEEVLGGIPGGASYHQGGGMVIGPDGFLYLGTGDNGVPDDAQDVDSLSGKVLRYTLDGEPAPDNPFDSPVYSYGHRNVEGLVFDDDGRLWASEFGQDAYDELNLIEPGENHGWPEVEGTGGEPEYVDPLVVWSTDQASPSGIAYWEGSLWLAALRGERLWEVPLDGARPGDPIGHVTDRGRIRNVVATADDSALWVVTSNTDGNGTPGPDDDRLLRVTR